MKNFKTLASLALVVVMLLAMMLPVNAGVISIPHSPEGDANATSEVYTAYKIFDVTKSVEGDEITGWAYSIKTTSPWFNLLNTNNNWVTLTASSDPAVYNVTPKVNFTTEDQAKSFAAYLMENAPAGASTITLQEGDNTVADGYYLIQSSLGSALALCTTDIPVNIAEKNTYPTINKSVDDHEAQIGDIVTFTTEVYVPETASDYIIVHDKMEAGLTLLNPRTPVTVTVEGETLTKNGTWLIDLYSDDDCTFELQLTPNAKILGKTVVITYQAMLNQEAELCPDSNDNVTWLEYSNYETPEITVIVKSFKLNIHKVNEAGERLDGAEFQLFTQAEGGEPVELIEVSEPGAEEVVYRVAESEGVFGATTTITAGNAVVEGLDSDVKYYLEETKAPAGYNKLDSRKEIALTTGTTLPCEGKNGEVTVENVTGREIPSTGGTGTKVLYVVGGAMVVGALVLLITKKRMSTEA